MTELKVLDIHEIGGIIRKVRKERGLRLEDLADDNISPATISNVERGVSHVKNEKVYYILEKLGIPMDQLPEFLLRERDDQAELKFRLTLIESMNQLGQSESALSLLEKTPIPDDHLYASQAHWLKGTCYLHQKKINKAEREFFTAIRLANRNETAKMDNIEAYSFNDLSRCSYYNNDLQQALQYADSGLDAFCPTGERPWVKYFLLRNKAIYLERLGRIVESLQLVQDVWEELPQIEPMETRLSFYWLRAELLRRSHDYETAKKFALEGIQLASLNQQYNSSLVLWCVLGSIHTVQEKWEEAENCFKIALGLPPGRVDEKSFLRACTQLGILYTHQEKWSQAEKYLTQAIQNAKRVEDYVDQMDASLALGRLFVQQNRREEAIAFYRQVVELAQKYHTEEKEYEAWHELARCWEGIDEKEFQLCTVNMFKVQEKLNQRKAGDLNEVR